MNYNVPDGSACGNDLAAERSMCARYILDSVLFWAEGYHMDGSRFDLMGLLDVKLMENIRAALDQRFGKEEKLLKKAAIPGFVNDGGLDGKTLLNCVRGWTGIDGLFSAPSQTISYGNSWSPWDPCRGRAA